MEKQIIKLLREKSIGKATAVIESLDLGIYIWRKKICVVKGGWDYDFDQITEKEQEQILEQVEQGNFERSNCYQG